jgi:hypothetical protein
MTCLACGQTHANDRLVTLSDGSAVSNHSEAWRSECEARHVLNMPTRVQRQNFLWDVLKKRGAAAQVKLKADIVMLCKPHHRHSVLAAFYNGLELEFQRQLRDIVDARVIRAAAGRVENSGSQIGGSPAPKADRLTHDTGLFLT